MKVTYAPLVSSASGRFGGMVATRWKGIEIIRRFAPPSNPNTADQQEVRVLFQTLTKAYVTQTTYLRLAWEAYASGRPFIGRNIWIGRNVPAMKGETDNDLLEGTPGDASTLGVVSTVVTPGDGTLSVAVTEPTLPTGWTIARAVSACVLTADWSVAKTYAELKWTEGEDDSSPYVCLMEGLTNDVEYQIRSFIIWNAPDGTLRYSVSTADQDTPTAA